MAIPSNLLKIRYGDVGITETHLSATWQLYHAQTSTVLESHGVQVPLVAPHRVEEAWAKIITLVESASSAALSKHEPIAAIGGFSSWDADLILDGWFSDTVTQKLVHPLSGTFSNVTYTGIVGLINAIRSLVLPPPTWAWCEPLTGGFRVKCVAVSGATSYNVYDGTTLLGTVPNQAWNTLTVPDGYYNVRIAPVNSAVGICSFYMPIQVGTGSLENPHYAENVGEPDSSIEIPKLSRWQRFKAWVKENDANA